MCIKTYEKRKSVKVRVSTEKMVRETGVSGESFDTLIRRLLFKKATGNTGEDPQYVKRELV